MDPTLAEIIAQNAAAFTPLQLRLLVNVVVVIAHADLVIDEAERASIQLALESTIAHSLTAAEVSEQIESARKRIAVSGGVRFAEQVGVNLDEAHLAQPAGVRLAYAIAAISEGVSEPERVRLRALVHGAKLSHEEAARIEAELHVS
jgi:hypothetical protein